MKNYEGEIVLGLALDSIGNEWGNSFAHVVNTGTELGVYRRGKRYMLCKSNMESNKCYYICRSHMGTSDTGDMKVDSWLVIDGKAATLGEHLMDGWHVWREEQYLTVIVTEIITADFVVRLSSRINSRYYRCNKGTIEKMDSDAALMLGIDAEEYIIL